MSEERKLVMLAYGAELIEVSKEGGMEEARDLALRMQSEGRGQVLDQFANPGQSARALRGHRSRDCGVRPRAHHAFRELMGTTGTIMGVSRYLKETNPSIESSACSPPTAPQFRVSGVGRRRICRRIFERERVDRGDRYRTAGSRTHDARTAASRRNIVRRVIGWRGGRRVARCRRYAKCGDRRRDL